MPFLYPNLSFRPCARIFRSQSCWEGVTGADPGPFFGFLFLIRFLPSILFFESLFPIKLNFPAETRGLMTRAAFQVTVLFKPPDAFFQVRPSLFFLPRCFRSARSVPQQSRPTTQPLSLVSSFPSSALFSLFASPLFKSIPVPTPKIQTVLSHVRLCEGLPPWFSFFPCPRFAKRGRVRKLPSCYVPLFFYFFLCRFFFSSL